MVSVRLMVSTARPRRTRYEVAEAGLVEAPSQRLALVGGPTTNSRCAPRAPRLSEPAREEAAAQPGGAAVVAGLGPVERRRLAGPRPAISLGEADRQARDHRGARVTLRRSTKAGPLGGPAAGARRVDGRQLGPDGLDQLALA